MFYNVSGCIVCDMLNEMVLCLVDIFNIVVIKDVIGNILWGVELIQVFEG